ncbi:uncharacterized protein LOC117168404 [Belonocnema kinseyi]|uniref:uncharacterized protein LOC117168404 n=1 Tax=Belonocnema kinseyi TaxID=2817044 RepID=UPI00143D1E85|nr:uncharacterized protein LOC117168404 [Belonocnema kinseyi]
MASRGCKYPADAFFYVCGYFIKTKAKKYSLETCFKMCEAYNAYFGMPVGDQDKSWAPHFACENCKRTLEGWYRGEKRAMKFALPRVWREPTDHSSNCFFFPHSSGLPVPTPPEKEQVSSCESPDSKSEEDNEGEGFNLLADNRNPYYPNQKDMNDLIRDLGLTKSNAELLTSRPKRVAPLH